MPLSKAELLIYYKYITKPLIVNIFVKTFTNLSIQENRKTIIAKREASKQAIALNFIMFYKIFQPISLKRRIFHLIDKNTINMVKAGSMDSRT